MSGRQRNGLKAPGTDWRLLTVAALVFAALYATTNHFFCEVPDPLPATADPARFAEGRVMQHLHQLATVIGHRQVGSVGEEQAAQYILAEVQKIAAEAAERRPDLVVEAARESVSGGVTMHAFKFQIANVYRNLTNVVLRVAPAAPAAARKKASTGPWGPDVVFQHTGDWTLAAYARSAPRPRGTTMAQDFFDLGLIPADTDYRMFSYRHYGSLPGIDIAFIFDGTAYHTARDEVARIRPGTLQAMGDNVLAAVQEFARVLATDPAVPSADHAGGSVYFDLWGRTMVIYSHAQAKALHHAPLFIILLLPLLGSAGGGAPVTWRRLAGSTALAAVSLLGAVLVPAAVGAARAAASGTAMVWYGRPLLAYAVYLPAAAAGLVLPYAALPAPRGAAASRSLGAALLFALLCSGLTSIGMHSSFFYALWAASAALAAAALGGGGEGGRGWGGAAALVACFLPPLAVVLPSSTTFMAHVMEKVGLAGGAPGLLGLVLADTAVGAVAGATVLLTLGTLTPYLLGALGPRRVRQLAAALLAASLAAAAVGSLRYPQQYSRDHPKRLLVQHIHVQGPGKPCACVRGGIQESKLSVVGLDSVPLAAALPPTFLQRPAADFSVDEWEALYPLNYLISVGEARVVPAAEDPDGAAAPLPALRMHSRGPVPQAEAGRQVDRLDLELDTGKGGAWGVMNFTLAGGGSLLGWSLSDGVAQTEAPQGGASHMVRFAGNLHARRYHFWLDVPAGEKLRVGLYVKFVEESAATRQLLADLPDWTSPAAVVSYHSRWQF
ncbi:hypothetical protein CHLNCDRAFT_142511 [Chlorella variabilis]|uniref:Uncharacterized protein n=1 Tax=Chlorella variabilis TaxID=554065 RepID=E1ZTT2_CHLVA|nr:hypothetical protein CHLNCDRAFT_142511 [Chlorella variabilis]EFN50786.1 hypothetical protein CHLNCDRAFT_142511 [Chlorella variabilis]|eukprot:XP_005852323.1 hypothetical protein CHLNCDRAFT_142511 [Chlorella variabilis]